ncbi:MAG: hypothetical protein AB8G11_01900 [Saprospiraceae bacterium]
MENSHFHQNRKRVHQAFFQERFLIPLIDKSEPIIIKENNGKATLQEVIIENFPITDAARPQSYILDLELNKPILGRIDRTKTAEIALLLFTPKRLVVFIIELKSFVSNKANKLSSIALKFEHSIGRVSMFLTSFIFDKATYEKLEIQYVGMVCLHDDKIPNGFKEHQLYDNLKSEKEDIFITNTLTGQMEKMIVKFVKSKDEKTPSMTIDFNKIFPKETYNFQADYTALTLPNITK